MAVVGVDDVSVWTFSAYPGSEIFSDLENDNRKPEFTDEYFVSLLSYSDLKNVHSWNEHFSNWQLKYLRLLGLILFYMTTYTLKPIRLVRNIQNVLKRKPQSRMEMIIDKALTRHRKKSKSKKEELLVK